MRLLIKNVVEETVSFRSTVPVALCWATIWHHPTIWCKAYEYRTKCRTVEDRFAVEQKTCSPIFRLGELSLRRLQCRYSSRYPWSVRLTHDSGDLHTLNIQQWISRVVLPHSRQLLGHVLWSCGARKPRNDRKMGGLTLKGKQWMQTTLFWHGQLN